MEEKKKGSPKTTHSLNLHDKSTDSARNIQSVRQLFLSGGKYTCKQLNLLTGGNDSRKLISILRHKEDWNIVDCRMPDGWKIYWLRKNDDIGPHIKTSAELADVVRKMVHDNLTKTEPTK